MRGVLQAHLISSWDGNAIRVNTIERFDSSQWHHVAVTYDGSSRSRGLKIYLDGAVATLQVTVDRLSETIRCDFPFAIGGRERRDYYQGRVDEVRAYDRVLTADEIFELYDLERSNLDPSAGSTLISGLVGHWSFDGIARGKICGTRAVTDMMASPKSIWACPKSSTATAAKPCGSAAREWSIAVPWPISIAQILIPWARGSSRAAMVSEP